MHEPIDAGRRRLVRSLPCPRPRPIRQHLPRREHHFGPIKQINAGVPTWGYVEAGPGNGPVALLLHGWPYDIHSFAEVVPVLTAAGYRVIVPYCAAMEARAFSRPIPSQWQQAALAVDTTALMDALKIDQGRHCGVRLGARTSRHRRSALADTVPCVGLGQRLSHRQPELNRAPLPPKAELQWWYQTILRPSAAKPDTQSIGVSLPG